MKDLYIIILSVVCAGFIAIFYIQATSEKPIEKLDKLIAADKYRDSLLLRIEERQVEEFREMRKEIEALKKELKTHKHPFVVHTHPCE